MKLCRLFLRTTVYSVVCDVSVVVVGAVALYSGR